MSDPSSVHIDLPSAKGPIGHLRYSYAGLRRLLQWRRQYAEIDAALRIAVERRDETLAALGEATLVGDPQGARFSAFAQTLTAIEADHGAATSDRDQLEIDLAAAEAERRDVLADYDGRIDRLRSQMDPVARRLESGQRALADLERVSVTRDEVAKNLEQRLERISEQGEDLEAESDAAKIAKLAEERHGVAARLEEIVDERGPRAAELEALRAPIADDRQRLDDITDDLDAQRESRQVARHAADLQVDDLRARLQTAGRQARELSGRRRAALVDLGREALRSESDTLPGAPRGRANQALAEITRLRRQRRALDERKAAFDSAPIRRTVMVVGCVFFALIVWWAVA